MACEIIAYECNRQNLPISDPGYLRNQGREVRVCVKLSEEYGTCTYPEQDHVVILDTRTRTLVRLNAIDFDTVAASNELTEYKCLRGVGICLFNPIPIAPFFLSANVINMVKGIGEGMCRVGARSIIAEDHSLQKITSDTIRLDG